MLLHPKDGPIPHLMTHDDRLADRVQSQEEFVRTSGATSKVIERRVEKARRGGKGLFRRHPYTLPPHEC